MVGVAKTGHYLAVNEAPSPYVYLPYEQNPRARMTLIAQSAGDPAALAAPLREAVRSIDANLPVYNLRTVATLYESRATDTWLQFFQMVGTMGFIGLALATTGLYGLVAYTVSRRVKEFGIRVALGASRRDVVWLVERRGLILALIGIAIGGALTAIAMPMLGAGFLGLGESSRAVYALVPAGVTDGQRGGKLSAGAKSRGAGSAARPSERMTPQESVAVLIYDGCGADSGAIETSVRPKAKRINIRASSALILVSAPRNSFHSKMPHRALTRVEPWPIA